MILGAISSLELKSATIIREEEKRIDSIRKIRQLLSKIDFDMEVVPLNNSTELRNLLESLKGDRLDDGEGMVMEDILRHSY